MTEHKGVHAEGGKQYSAEAGRKHTFWIQNYVMTISYLIARRSQMDSDFPKYILESSDGTYHQELSVGSDLNHRGHYMQLRFEKLKPGKKYKLTRFIADDFEGEVIFDGVPMDKIVDQDRPIHKILADHAYGEFEYDVGSAKPFL